jgi:acetyl esterase/lipase
MERVGLVIVMPTLVARPGRDTLLLALLLTGCGRLTPGLTHPLALPPAPRAGHVYVIRGYLDWYSTGMDRLTDELRAGGLSTAAYREEQWGDIADDLLAGPPAVGPTVLVGFSYGADDVILIARRLAERGRPVDLLVTIDPVTPAPVPANVRRCVSFYQPNGFWDLFPWLRGVPLHADEGAKEPENVNVRARADLVEPDTSHATIAANEKIHRAIVGLAESTCPPRRLAYHSDHMWNSNRQRMAGLVLACLAAGPATRPTGVHIRLPHIPANVVADIDVRYGPAANTANLLDVYRRKDVGAGPLPAVVWIHGGAWFLGDKTPCPALPLIDHGFVVVSINYRLTSAGPFPAQIEDCKGAIRFIRAHAAEYHVDPDRIGVWGESAGGHLAALLGTSGGSAAVEGDVGGNLDQSSRVQAVCDWFGPTDLTQFTAEATANGHPPGGFDNYIMRAFLGGDPLQHLDLVTLANPIHFLPAGPATGVPPFLIMHGDHDRTVPLAQSRLLADALVHDGVPTTFRVVAGLGHGFPVGRADTGAVTLAFFQRELGAGAVKRP